MTSSEAFRRDPSHWLYRLSPEEWIAVALRELRKAEVAFGVRDSQGLVAGAKRAAGMALNAALLVRPRETWGRTFVEHLSGLADDPLAPPSVREAAQVVGQTQAPSSGLIALRSRQGDEVLLEAARTVMAHAYAVVYGAQTRGGT
jgi:HEPN domain-containing protein